MCGAGREIAGVAVVSRHFGIVAWLAGLVECIQICDMSWRLAVAMRMTRWYTAVLGGLVRVVR